MVQAVGRYCPTNGHFECLAHEPTCQEDRACGGDRGQPKDEGPPHKGPDLQAQKESGLRAQYMERLSEPDEEERHEREGSVAEGNEGEGRFGLKKER